MKEHEQTAYNEYIAELKRQGRSVTHVAYGLKIFFEYLASTALDFRFLKIKDVEEFQSYLGIQTREDGRVRFTRASALNVTGAALNFYEFLKKKGQVTTNPFAGAPRLKRNKALPRNILNEENMNKLLAHLMNFMAGKDLYEKKQLYRAHVVAELMYSTGARVNEIAQLKPDDVDFYRGVVLLRDSKTGASREAILNSFAEKVLNIYITQMRRYIILERYDTDASLLFGARTYLKGWINTVIARESEKLGLGKFTSHNFRHAVGFHLLRAGCDIRFIQEILGHRTLHSTQVYTKVEKEDLRNVIDRYHPRTLRRKTDDEL